MKPIQVGDFPLGPTRAALLRIATSDGVSLSISSATWTQGRTIAVPNLGSGGIFTVSISAIDPITGSEACATMTSNSSVRRVVVSDWLDGGAGWRTVPQSHVRLHIPSMLDGRADAIDSAFKMVTGEHERLIEMATNPDRLEQLRRRRARVRLPGFRVGGSNASH